MLFGLRLGMQAVSAIAKKHNIKHCCDSTFATPVMLLPLELGCDIALHSTTKYATDMPPPLFSRCGHLT